MPARASACKRTGPGWAAPPSAACDLAFADAPLLAGLLLGAHLIGPQAPALVQPLIEAIRLGNIVDQAAGGVLSFARRSPRPSSRHCSSLKAAGLQPPRVFPPVTAGVSRVSRQQSGVLPDRLGTRPASSGTPGARRCDRIFHLDGRRSTWSQSRSRAKRRLGARQAHKSYRRGVTALSGHFPGPVIKAATSGLAELRARTGRSDAPAVPAGLPL